jgi:hypothetical protein
LFVTIFIIKLEDFPNHVLHNLQIIMKKIILRNGIYDAFSCQNDQTESVNPATNAIAKRGCASQEVLLHS